MKVSECCTAQAWHLEITDGLGICSECKDHATFVDELACETCGNGISEGEPHHKYEDVVECNDCYNYFKYEIGKTG